MRTLGLTPRSAAFTVAFLAVLTLAVLAARAFIDRWTDDIVRENTRRTEESVRRIAAAAAPLLDSLGDAGFFFKSELTRHELRTVNERLASVTAAQVVGIPGMEGGFYLLAADEMTGYSWPTSPAPKPAYGPAPRSYPIIKEQVLASIARDTALTEFHSFDFAIFPLATMPLRDGGRNVGGVWARIHVEKELPRNQLARVLNIAAIVAFGAFGAVLILFWIRRYQVNAIRHGLETLRNDPTYRLPERAGVYGVINSSINRMVDALMEEQRRREQLERDLHQQDKMATLGKLIAGVAHEVKTPLAVIKTRVQMWQRDLRQSADDADRQRPVQPDSLQLVVDEINRLSRLVKRLLLFSKPAAAKMQVSSIAVLLERVRMLVLDETQGRPVTVDIVMAGPLPDIAVDAPSLEQVFLNLCMNAVEAMPDGGRLRITAGAAEGAIIIHFDDDGKGIDTGIRERIFDPFFTTKEHGVGLGLSIAYEIVRSHQGSIVFGTPPEGSGTRCTITLPLGRKERTA